MYLSFAIIYQSEKSGHGLCQFNICVPSCPNMFSNWENLVCDSHEQAFVKLLLSAPLTPPQYRSISLQDFPFTSWQQLFSSVQFHSGTLEANVTKSRTHLKFVKELLFGNATNLQSGRVTREEFMHSLCMDEDNGECALNFSTEEFELLRQVISEQKCCGRDWANCCLTTTIMYNLTVASNTNSHLKLRRRSFKTLQSKVETLVDDNRKSGADNVITKLFNFRAQAVCTEQPSPNEQLSNTTCLSFYENQFLSSTNAKV
ncbi:hypothetical protein PHMEG_0001868 [Phytophthora megakarya]|uniref:Uncharacterized protein n=1 Tax=Phytophthora megakarya TaxID=4795 RepID=A0A225X256_9STRA|nr:hypothetical protein PHMEG_0001868 [Phytophthora megakarya]